MHCVGRLAPSPTGNLHLGNLSTYALAWAAARRVGGRLVYRVEDLDPPRTIPEQIKQQAEDLRWLGLDWDAGYGTGGDDERFMQSQRTAIYEAALAELRERDLVYPCTCSRREIADLLSAPHAEFDPALRYPGTCARRQPVCESAAAAIRFRAHGVIEFEDALCPPVVCRLDDNPGDFVVRRKDGLFAYQLAVVADDIEMGVTQVVRGRDLLDSTPRQHALFDALGAPRPDTLHTPLVVDSSGQRLAKRDGSHGVPGLRDAGWTPALLRGALMVLWGWRDQLQAAEMDSLLSEWDTEPLQRPEIRVPAAFFASPERFSRAAGSL